MDLKTTTTKFTYRIEAKPEGGFRAVPQDSDMETIEGPSREEVEQKIRAKLGEMITAQLPMNFKIGGANVAINTKFNFTQVQPRSATSDSEAKPLENSGGGAANAGPITPGDSSGSGLRVFAFLIAISALIYFFLHIFRR